MSFFCLLLALTPPPQHPFVLRSGKIRVEIVSSNRQRPSPNPAVFVSRFRPVRDAGVPRSIALLSDAVKAVLLLMPTFLRSNRQFSFRSWTPPTAFFTSVLHDFLSRTRRAHRALCPLAVVLLPRVRFRDGVQLLIFIALLPPLGCHFFSRKPGSSS